jgi:hypothetical protein
MKYPKMTNFSPHRWAGNPTYIATLLSKEISLGADDTDNQLLICRSPSWDPESLSLNKKVHCKYLLSCKAVLQGWKIFHLGSS